MALWGMYGRAKEELPRTNNSVEGWHRSFLANTGCCHPNIWIFISKPQKEQSLQEFSICQSAAGIANEGSRKRYKDYSQRIVSLVNDYDNRDIFDYLRGIAYNLSF
ncbi:uncharacterized protein LOC143034261 [Oratosquilla oratoria]|uniref:uncharacterized protein LOC143034261 n=1 Tax=Oratosquilla oratoria TaxID=337810 RepID=UPI003F76C19F